MSLSNLFNFLNDKHLPGKHPQKSHAGSRSSEALEGVDLSPKGAIGTYNPKTLAGTKERMAEIVASQFTQELQDRFISPRQKELQEKVEGYRKRGDDRGKKLYVKEFNRVKTDDLRRALHMENNIPIFSESKSGTRTENILDQALYGGT